MYFDGCSGPGCKGELVGDKGRELAVPSHKTPGKQSNTHLAFIERELLSIACWHYFDVLPPEERPGVEESIKVERGNGEKKEEDSDQEARSR